MDTSPLRASPAFRLLYLARSVALMVYGINAVAVAWQTYGLTRSSLHVALVGFCLAGGQLAGLVFGGRLADRHDRRTLMVGSRIAYVGVVGLLLGNALLPQAHVGLIYVAALAGGLSSGVGAPALMAALPSMVAREQLAAAGALSAISAQLAALLAPILAGALIAGSGLAGCYAAVMVASALTPLLLARLPQLSPAQAADRAPGAAAEWRDGLRFIRRSPMICGMLLLDLTACLLAMPFVLLPQIATETLGGDAALAGVLHAAPALGALAAALSSGWTRSLQRPGRVLAAMAVLWGMAVAAAGLAGSLWAMLACLALAGMADTVGDIVRGALLQQHTPDALRGRVSAFWLVQSTLGPALGGLQMGYVARRFAVSTALLAGGVACTVGSAAAWAALPALRRDPEPPAQA
ncbi:putative MFS-type transporter [Thauera linaloolentis 47Lol = DSM 12138]|uniref:Putative MFS-type transporter n=1 Tax=Thauera linaloolentis (strain DSM 12138 / JCM 21573 / CCUG 41526 / CIP 105981 / IAM 15112 / NBRC 102519 / 47Lol) TaxID=1123367 RepID=N6Z159_THAL4|nr:putative MFS-type transporter [Thauera linaloolentis 47Lol = DSM 12138]